MNKKKKVTRKQFSLYLSEDEKISIQRFAKRIGRTPAQLIREVAITIATHPEYEYILHKTDLFNPDPMEVDLMVRLLPEVTKLVKTINEITDDSNVNIK